MATKMLTYSQLGERLNCSPQAARALVRQLRLPCQKSNDGKVLVAVDLSEINHHSKPPSPANHLPAPLQALEGLQAQMARIEAVVTSNRADFERERQRLDQLLVELLQATLDAQTAKEAIARLESEHRSERAQKAQRSLSWWRRLTGWPPPVFSRAA